MHVHVAFYAATLTSEDICVSPDIPIFKSSLRGKEALEVISLHILRRRCNRGYISVSVFCIIQRLKQREKDITF